MASQFDWTSRKGKFYKLIRFLVDANGLQHRPQSAEQVHAWISRHLPDGPKPPLIRPFNWTRFATFTTLLLGGISIVSISGPYLLPLLQNRNLWAAISLIIVLLFTSGHMFNHIRKVPYVSGNGKGGISYFASGFSNQYGMETQIVAAICKWINHVPGIASCANVREDGILSFATIALALKVPRIAEPKKQQVAVVVWGCVMFGMYSFLLNVFKVKNGGYPFRLPPF